MSVRKLVEEFSALEDLRCGAKVEHQLIDILVIAVCAVIAGAEKILRYTVAAKSSGWARFWRSPMEFRPMTPSGACSC